ncbi:MAG TPA: Rieske 2Fe-2S domain-containing protein [Methylomirabilota bacterium]|nr:Rieske 2Fe-2S domain-containing protein [Methylomirabilota bacterium]
MESDSPTTSWRCAADRLGPGQTATFRLERNGKTIHGFIVNDGGRHYAYVNRCPHTGTPLDLWPNEFLAEDGRHLICATHGAVFEPHTGLCISGPCPGARLEALAVERRDGFLVVAWRS